MDNLIEQVVPKSRGVAYGFKIALIILIALGIPITLVVIAKMTQIAYLAVIAGFVLLFTIYGAWYFITSLKVEYEYAFLSSTLKIDKVIAKRRRRAIVKVDVKRFDDFFPYTDSEMNKHRFNKVYHAATKDFAKENYVACYHDEAKGKCAIVFTPNERLLAEMKPYFGNDLRKKLFLNKQL
ncbi:DUF6106 family protein [Ruminococcus sp.]|uniref:DUF6106 family protein n=1 Tax=Ruminococcus sp. TaxID=41978 RepID=UPI00388DDCE0